MVNSVAPLFFSEARNGVAIMALVDLEIFFMAATLSKCPILDFDIIGILVLRTPYVNINIEVKTSQTCRRILW